MCLSGFLTSSVYISFKERFIIMHLEGIIDGLIDDKTVLCVMHLLSH